MDVKTLSEIMGHVSSKTALDIYLHSTDAMKQQAANKIDRHFGKNTAADKEMTPTEKEKPLQAKFEPTKGKIRKRGTGCISKINDRLYEGRYSPRGADGGKSVRRSSQNQDRMLNFFHIVDKCFPKHWWWNLHALLFD